MIDSNQTTIEECLDKILSCNHSHLVIDNVSEETLVCVRSTLSVLGLNAYIWDRENNRISITLWDNIKPITWSVKK